MITAVVGVGFERVATPPDEIEHDPPVTVRLWLVALLLEPIIRIVNTRRPDGDALDLLMGAGQVHFERWRLQRRGAAHATGPDDHRPCITNDCANAEN